MIVPNGTKVPWKIVNGVKVFHMVAEENEDAIRVGREALALAERFGLEELQAHTLNNVGVARTIGGDTGGIGDLENGQGSEGIPGSVRLRCGDLQFPDRPEALSGQD